MSTKICPNCNAEVPSVAHLCKHCFHDFHVVVPKAKSPLFPILLFAVGSALVSAAAYGYIHNQNKAYNISIDQETQSMVFTTVYADRTVADRVYWADIRTIEYVKNASPRPYEVAVITKDGRRFIYQQGDDMLDFIAEDLSRKLDRPLNVVGDVLPAVSGSTP